jgi:hypothetical protein
MNTRLRLLLMLVTCAALFAGTWYFFGRERRQHAEAPPEPKQKTTQELLVGTWKMVEQDPPASSEYTYTIEFSPNGKVSLQESHINLGVVITTTGPYVLKGDVLELELRALKRQLQIESLRDDVLIVVSHEGGRTRSTWSRK